MPTTVEAVRRHLERDAALADTLLRGIASYRGTARWLIEEHGWDATEEAVVSALRRYKEDHTEPPLHRERELLEQTDVGLRTGLSLITVARSFELHEALQEAWGTMGPFDKMAVLPGRRHLRIMVQKSHLDPIREIFPSGSTQEILTPAAAVELKLPTKTDETSESGLVAHVVGMIIHRGIPIYDVATCASECSIFIPESQAIDAFEAATDLKDQVS